MMYTKFRSAWILLIALCAVIATQAETLPPLGDGAVPQTHAALWADFDPRAEPLDVEVLQQWEQDGVVLQVLRFRVGVFKGEKAMVAAVYGYPKGQQNLPGLVNIHGGGQYAHHHACLANARRGYATLSIAWAGRIHAPGYLVTPKEVQLFWNQQLDAPGYKLTTDWGALDGYHAPSRSGQDAFAALPGAAPWTLDAVPSPRNNAWFLNSMAARRALTFLEQQPEVDGDRLGVYGHSMGGKLTVLTAAADERVRAAAPSCGGISDIRHKNALHHNTLGDLTSLRQITCPILFQSPANDFHGRIDDLPGAVQALRTEDWRITCAPHHNHQDTPEYEVAAQLWFDQHLQGTFRFPQTPQCALQLRSANGVPTATVEVDTSQSVVSVDVYYSQPRPMDAGAKPADDYKHRFWRHAQATRKGDVWQVALPLIADDQPLRVYANVRYALPKPVISAGYYYAIRSADEFVLSSVLQTVSPAQLQAAEVQVTLRPSAMIERFEGDWQQAWFNYGKGWARSTHKVNDAQWAAPRGAKLALQVSCERPNQLAVIIDGHRAAVHLRGGGAWEAIELSPADFNDAAGAALSSFQGIQQLRLQPVSSAEASTPRWQGAPPVFNDLHWSVPQIRALGTSIPGQPDAMWTYKQVDGKALELSVFLPEGYASSTERFPTFVVFHGGSWAVGEANWHYPDCEYWSRRGMIAVSVDYRLSKRDGVEVPLECVKDAKSAVRFLRKHAAALKVDSDKIVIAGGSAGGQLAAAMATLSAPFTNDACYDLSISCEPNAVILYNPYFRCAPALSPPNFLRPGLPPFITFLGDQDPAISVASLEDFHNQLKAHGGDSEYYVAKGGKHGLCNGRNPRNPFFYWSLELEDQFLVKHGILSGPSRVQPPQGVKVLQPETDYISYR